MNVKETKTLEDLQFLYNHSAMTWEGLREEDFQVALETCGGEGAQGYLTKGEVMNDLCQLTGSNAYPDDLNIFSVVPFKGLAIMYGARWMDDIIDNNAYRESFHPFNSSYGDDENLEDDDEGLDESLTEEMNSHFGYYENPTVSEYRDFLQDAMDVADEYDDDDKVIMHPNTYNIGVPFAGTYGGYIDMNNPVGGNEEFDESLTESKEIEPLDSPDNKLLRSIIKKMYRRGGNTILSPTQQEILDKYDIYFEKPHGLDVYLNINYSSDEEGNACTSHHCDIPEDKIDMLNIVDIINKKRERNKNHAYKYKYLNTYGDIPELNTHIIDDRFAYGRTRNYEDKWRDTQNYLMNNKTRLNHNILQQEKEYKNGLKKINKIKKDLKNESLNEDYDEDDFNYKFIVYELDENGDELNPINSFDTKEEAIEFAQAQSCPTHIVYAPMFDPDDYGMENEGEYEDFEVVWESENNNINNVENNQENITFTETKSSNYTNKPILYKVLDYSTNKVYIINSFNNLINLLYFMVGKKIAIYPMKEELKQKIEVKNTVAYKDNYGYYDYPDIGTSIKKTILTASLLDNIKKTIISGIESHCKAFDVKVNEKYASVWDNNKMLGYVYDTLAFTYPEYKKQFKDTLYLYNDENEII